jgi:hypothetical protein
MPNQDSANTPSPDSQEQSVSQAPVTPIAPQQNEMREESNSNSHKKESDATKLQRDIKIGEICLIVINFFLLVTTIVIAVIYSGQLTEMRKSTKAAQDAANAAESAADIAHESLISTQRAYVTFKEVKVEQTTRTQPSVLEQVGYNVALIWENSGTTPAPLAKQHFRISRLKGEPMGETFFKVNEKKQPTTTYIGPKATVQTGSVFARADVLPKLITPITIGTPTYIWGWIVYRDIFSFTKPHVTEVCSVLSEVRITPISPKINDYGFFFNRCEHHNCTDDNCEDYNQVIAESG